ncbi:MAG: hypothetical protein ACE5HT_11570 [Gemmatimonadales bacterium]
MDRRPLVLFGWTLFTPHTLALRAQLAVMESIVCDELAGAITDPVVREHTSARSITKQVASEREGRGWVRLKLFGPPDAAEMIGRAVQRYIKTPSARVDTPSETDLVLHPLGQDYRRGLSEITDIALDLHTAPAARRMLHKCLLVRVGCSAEDPRFELHPYLATHSSAYVRLSGIARDEGGSWGWGHEEFWARLFTPGPARGLQAPLWSLWNIVLGIDISRRESVRSLEEKLGLNCP